MAAEGVVFFLFTILLQYKFFIRCRYPSTSKMISPYICKRMKSIQSMIMIMMVMF